MEEEAVEDNKLQTDDRIGLKETQKMVYLLIMTVRCIKTKFELLGDYVEDRS